MSNSSVRNRVGTGLMVVGTVAILAALAVYLMVYLEEKHAADFSANVMEQIIAAGEPEEKWEDDPYWESLVKIDGLNYMGYLSFAGYDVNLPVIADWNFNNLRNGPARYLGSVATNNLIIAGHNYRTQFDILLRMVVGDRISFTDVAKNTFHYVVESVETLSDTAVEEMVSGDWDMTLFTCTYGGRARVAVRCMRIS